MGRIDVTPRFRLEASELVFVTPGISPWAVCGQSAED
jgi:hypothetical protein